VDVLQHTIFIWEVYHMTGVNQRPKAYLYSGPTSMLIISLPSQPYHIIEFSFIFKHEFSEIELT
jgi:hypothetical protein